jgi:phosphoribosylformimino-5-aminoimidazole carboxamide ribotide isomerase
MLVIPSIDLRAGEVVRLYRGDFSQITIYKTDHVDTARAYELAGAELVHVIDLDGASGGVPTHFTHIANIVSSVSVPVQMGGGLRSKDSIKEAFDIGVSRVILGTAAYEMPELAEWVIASYGAKALVVSLDVHEGFVALKGWRDTSEITVNELLRQMNVIGVDQFIFTDISTDGTLGAPNFLSVEQLVDYTKALNCSFISSGGVATIEHLKELRDLGCYGAIVGKALYEGRIDLKQAISEVITDSVDCKERGNA